MLRFPDKITLCKLCVFLPPAFHWRYVPREWMLVQAKSASNPSLDGEKFANGKGVWILNTGILPLSKKNDRFTYIYIVDVF